MPRDLLQKAKARGDELAIRLQPVVAGLADQLLLDDPQDIKGANKLLTDFLQWAKDHEEPGLLSSADQWFQKRSKDSVTPVSGDVRISFTRARDTFIQQQRDEDRIILTTTNTFWALGDVVPGTKDPEAIRAVKLLALCFYIEVGETTGNTALEKTEQYLDEFLQNFKAGSRDP